MILSRSLPPADRAGLGSTGLVLRPRSGSGWAQMAAPPEAMPSSWFHNLRGEPARSGCSPAAAGWLICEADGCRRIILTIGSH